MYGINLQSFQAGLMRIADLCKYQPDLGEFSGLNVFQSIDGSELRCDDAHESRRNDAPQQASERIDMPRTASKDKVHTITAETLASASDWKSRLTGVGFIPASYQYNGDGEIVSATCTKNEKDQVITPELLEVIAA